MRRPYKEPWPVDEITDYIQAGSGGHFDPELVQVFLRILPILMDIKTQWKETEDALACVLKIEL